MLPEEPSHWPSDKPEQPLAFFSEWETYTPPPIKDYLAWIEKVALAENCQIHKIQYIFCNDAYLHDLNVRYLDHDTLTDIITFPFQEPPILEGDIFISVERVNENARELGLAEQDELDRVMIHGLLHLCGYRDKSPEEKAQMTQKENEALQIKWRL